VSSWLVLAAIPILVVVVVVVVVLVLVLVLVLQLTDEEIDDEVNFWESLSSPLFTRLPRPRPSSSLCRWELIDDEDDDDLGGAGINAGSPGSGEPSPYLSASTLWSRRSSTNGMILSASSFPSRNV
jgi:hypothetical protein